MNTGVNTDMNTDMNMDMNTGVNTDMNTGMMNTGVNTDMNTGMNTGVNTGVNTDMNTGVNTDMNTGVNTDMNMDMNERISMVTIYCPGCYNSFEIENISQTVECSCGRSVKYDDFTCPPYIERDDHGAVVSNLGRNSYEASDIRMMKGYTFVIKENYREEYLSGDREPRLVIISPNRDNDRQLTDFFTTTFCVDEKYIYFDQAPLYNWYDNQGIFRLEYANYGLMGERVCDNPGIKYMISYSDYFVFVSKIEQLAGKILIMPKTGEWIRKLCNGGKLNIFGNWAYYAQYVKKDDSSYHESYVIRRVSLDGKRDIPMTAIPYMNEETLNVNHEGVFFNSTDNLYPLHYLGHFETKLKNGDLFGNNSKQTALIDVVSAGKWSNSYLKGNFNDPLILSGEYIVCQNTTKVSLATGEVSDI